MLLTAFIVSCALDTVALKPAVAMAVKPAAGVTVTRLSKTRVEGTENPKELSAFIPGIHLPDYGASLTSSIYVRGFGSRMENPVVGLYIDDFPVIDKNAYDLDYLDLASIIFLHGPQGTAYGRNALMGVLSLRTQAPDGETRLNLSVEGGTYAHARAQLFYKGGNWAVSAAYRHSGGYFMNECKGSLADPYNGGQLRICWERQVSDSLFLSNLLQAGFSSEGGFPYGAWDGNTLHPVSYNDEGSYKRFTLLDGFKAQVRKKHVQLHGMSSLQVLIDDMHMDQDYLPASIFTLEQEQKSAALTLEALARPTCTFEHWKPVTGVFAFFKYNHMAAPVTFKRDGIRQLILDNANAGIPEEIGRLEIPDDAFPVGSLFHILSWNAALYHESTFPVGDWLFTAGLRLDYEGAWMGYDCTTSLHYQLVPMMTQLRAYTHNYSGNLRHGTVELLPKLSVQYRGFPGTELFATVSKGYRAGGFNTQIFSDILQNQLMSGMMADMGVYLAAPSVSAVAGNTEYQPEEAWNFEAGLSYDKNGFQGSVSAFWIEALRQQLTVFPPGKTTGRMMTNAGRSRSLGVEASASYLRGGWEMQLSWGWNRARFLEYSDGQADYAGIRYRAFYFKSMGNEFFQRGKPLIAHLGVKIPIV